jgi:hypothetical protein
MPVSDDEYRSYSLEYGAHYVPFTQTTNLCAGLTAMWLRNAITMKDHFWDKYSDIQAHKFVLKPGAKEKAEKLQSLFSDADNERSRKKDKDFIVAGRSGVKKPESDKVDKPKVYAKKTYQSKLQDIIDQRGAAGNIDNLKDAFEKADGEKGFLRISVDLYNCKASHAHAADFCNLQPRVRYFDPLLGDFLFPNMDKLVAWWARCYHARDTNTRLGAFDHYGQQFLSFGFQIFNKLDADGKYLAATEIKVIGDLY